MDYILSLLTFRLLQYSIVLQNLTIGRNWAKYTMDLFHFLKPQVNLQLSQLKLIITGSHIYFPLAEKFILHAFIPSRAGCVSQVSTIFALLLY